MPENHSAQRFLSALTELCERGCIDSRKFQEQNDISSERTMQRFIKDFKEFVPVKYDRAKKVYVRTNDSLPLENMLEMFSVQRSDEEILYFFNFVKSMIKSGGFLPPVSTGTSNGDEYRGVLTNLEKLVSASDARIYSKIEYYNPQADNACSKVQQQKIFSEVIRSFKTDRMLKVTYDRKDLLVQPVKVISSYGRWYLAAIIINEGGDEPAVLEFSHIEYIKVTDRYISYDAIEPDMKIFYKLIKKT